ncbi:hypothetical protein [Marinomonas rhizomae]|uniref:hypothetical protein n=1 Tax=Marinomonas rhizomae TaxID=491948 RepID=UPI001314F4DA|nr:hypothetical protein [Marinomonas rhizomae]
MPTKVGIKLLWSFVGRGFSPTRYLDSIQTLWIHDLYSALLVGGLVPSPFVFQGEG